MSLSAQLKFDAQGMIPAITREHYIRRNETVDPTTAGMLGRMFG